MEVYAALTCSPGVQDSAPVKPKQPAKSVTVEDSFKSCTTPQAARHVLKILVPDLLARLKEEFEVQPHTFFGAHTAKLGRCSDSHALNRET